MRTVDFYELTRAAQDHFVDATTGAQPPAPLLVHRSAPTGHRVGWVIAVVALVVALVLFQRGFGELGSDGVVHGVPLLVVWAVLFAVMIGAALHALAGERANTSLPWKPGVYCFPTYVVDARRPVMRIWQSDEIKSLDGDGGTVRVTFAEETFTFVADPDAAQRARTVMAMSDPELERKARVSMNPVAEPRVSSPLAPTHPRKKDTPAWARLRFVVAGALALLLGPGLWYARNSVSDDRAFAAARAKNEVAGYRAYLERGVRHRDEVQRTLLPRAELTVAERAGTVDAILAYQKAHPSSAIQKDVDAALRKAMLAELDVARKEGTLAALDAFASKRPEHGVDAELKAARHDVYQQALAAFRATANEKDPQVVAFFDRLVAHAEAKSNPKVEIRFRQQPSTSLNRADKYVTKQPLFNGETSYPSKYFEQGKLSAQESALGKALVERLSASFPKEILSFSIGAPVPEGEGLPAVTVPTLFVVYRPEWTGTAYPSHRPRGIYVGINLHFDASFAIPNDNKPLKVHHVISKSVPLNVLKEFAAAPPNPGDPEKAAYTAMSSEGFDAFAAKFAAHVYKKNGK